jgi:hypothetical protein
MGGCEIASEPGFEDSRVLLANEATKTNLMELNRTGELAKYRIVPEERLFGQWLPSFN